MSAGVNMILDPATMRGNAIAGFTSVTGRSHTFDVRADGYARGEVVDVFVSRLSPTHRQRGGRADAGQCDSAGWAKCKLTAPSGQAQGVLSASSLTPSSRWICQCLKHMARGLHLATQSKQAPSRRCICRGGVPGQPAGDRESEGECRAH